MANSNAKISKPTLYIIGALVGFGAWWFTKPSDSSPTVVKKIAVRSASKTNDGDLITPADRTATFTAYKGPRHDAFLPLVVVNSHGISGTGNAGNVGGRGLWTLTGITTINGRDSALVENTTTGADQTLRVGDRWNDRRVVAIGEDNVTLMNAQGQRTELTFPPAQDPTKKESTEPIAEAEPTPAPPTIIQPNITIQAPAGITAPGGGGGFNPGGGGFPFGFPGGGNPGGGGDNNQ